MPKSIETMTINEVVRALRNLGVRTSPDKIAAGIQQGVYPYGVCISMPGKRRYFEIYKSQFDEWVDAHAIKDGGA